MQRTRILISMLLLSLASAAIAQQPRIKPVPETMIADDRLQPPGLGFSIQRPDGGWKWFQGLGELGQAFQLVNPARKQVFMVLVMPLGQELFTRDKAESFFQDMRRAAIEDGANVVDIDIQASSIPFPGSFRATHGTLSKEGKRKFWTGYLVAAGSKRFCVIEEIRLSPGESPVFTSFVRSFRLIHEETQGRRVDDAPAKN